jgi:hypothetical protein
MKGVRIAPIVEGHGEYESIRILLTRIGAELLDGAYLDVLRPIRHKRGQLAQHEKLSNAIQLAALKLADAASDPMRALILVLADADEDLPCVLAPKMLQWAKNAQPGSDIACVLANPEYETWFVAAAESLQGHLNLPVDFTAPDDPEREHCGKHWVERNFRGAKYSETQDQASMAAKMDLTLCRKRSRSFDKLCRELEKRIAGK